MRERRSRKSVPIRLLVVDDHAVVRSGLRLLLDAEEGIEVVGEAGSVRDAVFEVRLAKPTHRHHIMQKLRLTTRAELVHYAVEQRLFDSTASA